MPFRLESAQPAAALRGALFDRAPEVPWTSDLADDYPLEREVGLLGA
ncbi:MAG: hypothetical protein SFW67_10610 [Myxococcaceae bacterium]|nr:hypothetical protein [Myxococcaceae bacterium]